MPYIVPYPSLSLYTLHQPYFLSQYHSIPFPTQPNNSMTCHMHALPPCTPIILFPTTLYPNGWPTHPPTLSYILVNHSVILTFWCVLRGRQPCPCFLVLANRRPELIEVSLADSELSSHPQQKNQPIWLQRQLSSHASVSSRSCLVLRLIWCSMYVVVWSWFGLGLVLSNVVWSGHALV